MIRRSFLLIAGMSLLATAGRAQILSPAPPAQAISAASAAFPEYNGIAVSFDEQIKLLPRDAKVIPIRTASNPGFPSVAAAGKENVLSGPLASLVKPASFVGTVVLTGSQTYATGGDRFVVTLYSARVVSASVNDAGTAGKGSIIYLARAGGELPYAGKVISAEDYSAPLLTIGHTYLIFGQKLSPETYKVTSTSALELTANGLAETGSSTALKSFLLGKSDADLLKEAFQIWQQIAQGPSCGGAK